MDRVLKCVREIETIMKMTFPSPIEIDVIKSLGGFWAGLLMEPLSQIYRWRIDMEGSQESQRWNLKDFSFLASLILRERCVGRW